MKIPPDLYQKHRGVVRLDRFTRPEFELPMLWRIFEWKGKQLPRTLKFLGAMSRPEAVRRCIEGTFDCFGIIGVPYIDIYDKFGERIWWKMRHADDYKLPRGEKGKCISSWLVARDTLGSACMPTS